MSTLTTVTSRLRSVVFGHEDPRLRATWRFILAWPLLPLIGVITAALMPILGVSGMIPGGPIQGVIMLLILFLWARYIDQRALTEYGVSATCSWVVNLLVGFLIVVGVWTAWHALATSFGWMQIDIAVTTPQGSLPVTLGGILVSLAINTWVQDVVFFAIIVASAAEGFRSRGIEPRRAVLGAWVVGWLFFTAIHGTPTVLDTVSTAVGGAVFGALYIHTGELALPIGVHWGASYAAGTIFVSSTAASQKASIVEVTKSFPDGIEGVVILLYVLTYLVAVGWLRFSKGAVTIETGLTDWASA